MPKPKNMIRESEGEGVGRSITFIGKTAIRRGERLVGGDDIFSWC